VKSSRFINGIILFMITVLIFSLSGVRVFAASDDEYLVAAYDVTVNINSDGSAYIMEHIDFTFFDGFNNIMIPIWKNEGEEIEVSHVYMQRKDELIECRRLLAGQWDAEVFTGTYSVIDEPDHVKLKIYGSFYRSSGSVFVHYKVKNAVRRYQDVAEYQRIHIPKLWETRVSSINIAIRLPEPARAEDVELWMHGVFVGIKSFTNSQIVRYNVPDTVPGEYVETRVIFPQKQVSDCPMTDDSPNRDRIVAEELEYQVSDKADLLEAREAAARKAGQKASFERMRQRVRNLLGILSLLLVLSCVYYALFIRRKLRYDKKSALPSAFSGIDRLDPAEVRMLVTGGRTGARAMMGKLMELVSRGFLSPGIRKSLKNRIRFTFKVADPMNGDELNDADRYFLDRIIELSSSNNEFDPIQLLGFTDSDEKAARMKALYDGWLLKAREAYHERNILDSSMVRYRNFGLVYSVLLLFLGFLIPVAFSVAIGYVIFPAGLLLLAFSLRIRKFTVYGADQLRIWKAVRLVIKKDSLTLDALPEWMRSCPVLMGYGVALGIEKDATRWIMAQNHGAGCPLCGLSQSEELEDYGLNKIVRNTLNIMDEAISSLQDV
jgi:hypothetical protein